MLNTIYTYLLAPVTILTAIVTEQVSEVNTSYAENGPMGVDKFTIEFKGYITVHFIVDQLSQILRQIRQWRRLRYNTPT